MPFRRVAAARLSQGNAQAKDNEYFLKTPTGHLLVLGEQERFLWALLDGTYSFSAIAQQFHERFGAPDTSRAIHPNPDTTRS